LRYLLREIWANSSLLGELIVLAVVCAVLQNLQVAFARAATAQLAYAVTFLVLIVLALGSFTVAVNAGQDAIDRMVSFVQAILPVLLTLMVAVGGIGTAAILHPVITVTLGILGTLIKDIVFPLVYFAAVLGVVNQISERLQVSRLAELLRSISVICLGLFLTIFTGVLSVQGISRSVADGVALRTTKFVTGAFIPVVGKYLSDAVEAVVGSSLLLKTAVGLAGVIGLLAIAIFPAIKIIAMVLIYRLAAALVQPFGDARIASALQDMGNSITLIFAAVAAVGLMFFIAITIIVGLGNVTVMLR
jgi:stage III sporulation protein AE